MATTGDFNFDLDNVSGVTDNSMGIAEKVVAGIDSQGSLIGTIIGIAVAVALLIGMLIAIFGIVLILFSMIKRVKTGGEKIGNN